MHTIIVRLFIMLSLISCFSFDPLEPSFQGMLASTRVQLVLWIDLDQNFCYN